MSVKRTIVRSDGVLEAAVARGTPFTALRHV